ncbi:MAG: hypothetical protein KPEEDBHJ_00632 [Anaerolineales bacterium]|nr:hypothetical protein [Anaerolineales bacterium]
MESISAKKFLQTWLWALAVVGALAILQTIQRTHELEIALFRSKWIGLVGVFGIASLGCIWLSLSHFLDIIAIRLENKTTHTSNPLRITYYALLILACLAVPFVRLYVFGSILPQTMPILWVFLWAGLIQTISLKRLRKMKWTTAFAIVILTQGALYQTWGIFAATSANPFSMGYSEAGRHYYASLFFSQKLYGMELPLPFLHPSRYLLLSIPFLVDGLPLWAHRLWQALLWFGLTLGSAYFLARRMKSGAGATIVITAWAFLFFLQGAVYYHLQVMVILVLAGVSVKHLWRSLFFIVLASIWAGISRVNWFPVPAMLAIAIYVLETPIHSPGAGRGGNWTYWIIPFVWGISGVVAALVSQFTYIQISGNADAAAFGSSFTSDLIWSRLLPNETFPMGILPGILLVSAPAWIAVYQMARNNKAAIHPLRWAVLTSMLAVLFVGGAVVSTKIGGGGDLHNMDAYLVMLSVLATFIWANQACPERRRRAGAEAEAKPMMGRVGWGALTAALLIPLGFAIRHIGFYPSFDQSAAEKDIQSLQDALDDGSAVLFVTERQLITFDYLHGVTLAPEYEQSELMEMAMSRNRQYLEAFYGDLEARRFALIVAEDQKFTTQKAGAFVEENVAWVRFVGAPLLCNYKPVVTLTANNLQVFEPRPKQAECRDPFAD